MKFHVGAKTGNPQIPNERFAHVDLSLWGGYVAGHAVRIEVKPEGVIVRNYWGEPPFMVRRDQFETNPEV